MKRANKSERIARAMFIPIAVVLLLFGKVELAGVAMVLWHLMRIEDKLEELKK